jgi:CRP/FNR family nitrogen fixation transcriptional regulator
MAAQLAASPPSPQFQLCALPLDAVGLRPQGEPAREEGLHAPGTVQHFVQDRQIYADGDPANHLYKVVSGVVRACKFLNDGRRQIEAFYVEGDVFGFEAGATYTICAEAVTSCTLVAFRRKVVEALAQKDNGLSAQLLAAMLRAFSRTRAHALVLGRRGAAEKVALFLAEWAGHSAGTGLVQLAMTRQDIADFLGLTIETVSRTLTQFERDRLIALPNIRQIQLCNRAALNALAA